MNQAKNYCLRNIFFLVEKFTLQDFSSDPEFLGRD